MNKELEKVARAIQESVPAYGDDDWMHYTNEAKAAIQALIEIREEKADKDGFVPIRSANIVSWLKQILNEEK